MLLLQETFYKEQYFYLLILEPVFLNLVLSRPERYHQQKERLLFHVFIFQLVYSADMPHYKRQYLLALLLHHSKYQLFVEIKAFLGYFLNLKSLRRVPVFHFELALNNHIPCH